MCVELSSLNRGVCCLFVAPPASRFASTGGADVFVHNPVLPKSRRVFLFGKRYGMASFTVFSGVSG
jgi:hypothetical protein